MLYEAHSVSETPKRTDGRGQKQWQIFFQFCHFITIMVQQLGRNALHFALQSVLSR